MPRFRRGNYRPRRIRSRKKFIRKRKRSFRRKGSVKKQNYEGVYKVQGSVIVDWVQDNAWAASVAKFEVGWARADLIAANECSIQNVPEFQKYFEFFSWFCVRGCKIEYVPLFIEGGSEATTMRRLQVGSYRNPGILENLVILTQTQDYFCGDPAKGFKKYIRPHVYRKRNATENTTAQLWQQTEDVNPYVVPTIVFAMTSNRATGFSIGDVKVTYYIWFKQPRSEVTTAS